MKKITPLISLLFVCIISSSYAQVEYFYTLLNNGNDSFTIAAVPESSSSNFQTSVQSYGFTIILPDGVTANITSSLGSAANATFFDGSAVGEAENDGYLITETLGAPINIDAPANATNTPMVTIQINDMPTMGEILILANNSILATNVPSLKSFLTADTTDNGMTEFLNTIDENASGLVGDSSATLSLSETIFTEDSIIIFPNPSSRYITINSTVAIDTIELYTLLGKKIGINFNTNSQIDVSNLTTGIYLMKISSDNKIITKKFVVE